MLEAKGEGVVPPRDRTSGCPEPPGATPVDGWFASDPARATDLRDDASNGIELSTI